MTAFTLPVCKVVLSVAWSIAVHSSSSGRKRGASLLGAEFGVLMVTTWFTMRSCTRRRFSWVLYLCTCGTMWVSVDLWCAVGGIHSVSMGMMWGARQGDRLSVRTGWNGMSPCSSNLGSDIDAASGVAYGVASGVFTLRDGFTCVGAAMLKISES